MEETIRLTVFNPYTKQESVQNVKEYYALSTKSGTWFLKRYFKNLEDAEFCKTELEKLNSPLFGFKFHISKHSVYKAC